MTDYLVDIIYPVNNTLMPSSDSTIERDGLGLAGETGESCLYQEYVEKNYLIHITSEFSVLRRCNDMMVESLGWDALLCVNYSHILVH